MNNLTGTDNLVVVQGLSISYFQRKKEIPALREVSFAIPRATTCALIGPSGCGKSSLLNVIAGLMPPSSGSVIVDGDTLTVPRRSTALILQDYGLLPWKRVAENVGLGLEIRGFKREQRLDRVKSVLQEVGMWELRHRFPSQLSGGQRQRVGIARALALEPDLLLMDEPFSSLDALTREMLQEQLLQIWKNKRITIIIVTHSIDEAIYLGQQIIVLSGNPGRMIKIVDNPGVGSEGYRDTTEFHQLSSMLRSQLSR